MSGLSTSGLAAILIPILVVCWLIRLVLSRRYLSYIPGPPRKSWWKGNLEFLAPNGWDVHNALNKNYGGVARLEIFSGQHLSVYDPLALHHILLKDQAAYVPSALILSTFQLTLGPSLLATTGETHKRQRKMLNPMFSTKSMREIFPMIVPVSCKLRDALEREVRKGNEYVDVMDWVSRATLEGIGHGGFGHSFNLFEKDADEYSAALTQLSLMIAEDKFLQQLFPLAVKLGPAWFRRAMVKCLPFGDIPKMVRLVDVVEGKAKAILKGKRESLERGKEKADSRDRKDIMSIILRAYSSRDGADSIPESELIAHMSTFLGAGQDTTKSAISHTLYVLSKHQGVQSRLREEIRSATRKSASNGEFNYDTVMDLPLLDAVCRETLRVYPPVTIAMRVANQDVVLPLLWPIRSTDGKSEIREIPLKKGTSVWLSILGSNMCKAIWGEDAEEWKPERWLQPLPKSVDDARLPGVFSQMMTFIAGHRSCIGFKFAEMELKLALFMLLERLIFEPGPEVSWKIGISQYPVVEDPPGLYEPGMLPMKVSLAE